MKTFLALFIVVTTLHFALLQLINNYSSSDFFFQAGLSAAPARAVSAVKNMSIPQQIKDIRLPDLPQAIKDLKF
jgi:hypothetical protein